MTTPKLSHGEAKVLQALRAGPMELYVLEERFTGNLQPWLASLKEKQLIQSSEYGWKITPAGRAACPSRRDMEKPEHLPQAAIAVPRKQTKAQTIGINAIKQQHIKQPEAIMQTLTKLTDDAEKPSALQVQEGGDHYKNMAIQPVQYIIANNLGFIEGNVVKYVSRWKNKNGVQDLKKARHFLDILIEQQSAA